MVILKVLYFRHQFDWRDVVKDQKNTRRHSAHKTSFTAVAVWSQESSKVIAKAI